MPPSLTRATSRPAAHRRFKSSRNRRRSSKALHVAYAARRLPLARQPLRLDDLSGRHLGGNVIALFDRPLARVVALFDRIWRVASSKRDTAKLSHI